MADNRSKFKILLAVSHSTMKGYPDPSISSRQAFEFTLNSIVRSDTSRFKIFVLHVHSGEAAFGQVMARGVPLVAYFDNICREAGIATEAWVKEGVPKEVICEEVRRLRPHLLVVGCRNLNVSERSVMTSVSKACATRAECPVLIVKRKPEDTPETSALDD